MDNQDSRHWFIQKFYGFSQQEALIDEGIKYTYTDLLSAIDRARQFIENENVAPGQVIAILSDYTIHSISVFFALLEKRNIIVPITTKVENEINERFSEGNVDKAVVSF